MERKIKITFLITALCIFLILSSLNISASFLIGNKSFDLLDKYSGGDFLKGWINISFNNEPFNSPITLLPGSGTLTIEELLNKNPSAPYSCSTSDCNMSYSASSSTGSSSTAFTLNSGASSIIGLKISNPLNVDQVTNLKLAISSSATESCNSPIKIDIGDDGQIDWTYKNYNPTSYCTSETYSTCYSGSTQSTPMIIGASYCQNINLSSGAALKVGANITKGTATSTIRFSLGDETNLFCETTVSSAGIVSCIINKTLESPQVVNICVTQKVQGGYEIPYEQNSPVCGSDGSDFAIFAQPIRFSVPGTINVNVSNDVSAGITTFASLAEEYIDIMYNLNCSGNCFIPIKFYSGQNSQTISITDNTELKYKIGSVLIASNNLYNLTSQPSLISSGFIKLFLNNSGLKVPQTAGLYNLSLRVNNAEAIKKSIEIIALPVFQEFYPIQVPAGADVPFVVVVGGNNITGYTWDFGDNSSIITTTKPLTIHRYNDLSVASRTVKITAISPKGSQTATYTVNVTLPKDYINTTLSYYESKIISLRNQIANEPSSARTAIENSLDLESIDSKIASLRSAFNNAGNSTLKYLDILPGMRAISLPEAINVTKRVSGSFIMDPNLINTGDVLNMTGEDFSGNDSLLKNAIFDWFLHSFSVDSKFITYSAIYKNSSDILGSYAQFDMSSPEALDTVYVFINKNKDSFSLSGVDSSKISSFEESSGFDKDISSGKASFEIFTDDDMDIINAPIYFTPLISNLPLFEITECNYNRVCEKGLGENSDNCLADCKPVAKTAWLLVLVFVIFFVLYILAQEWYKRYYMNYLFKDKNDLFNLVHFILIGEKQGLKKEELFQKLREKGWHGEQIEFAYKKFKGQRTGMFEIPIFSFLEKKDLAKQMDLRNKIGMNPSITPRPIRPFSPNIKQPIIRPLSQPAKSIVPSDKPVLNSQVKIEQKVQEKPAEKQADLKTEEPKSDKK